MITDRAHPMANFVSAYNKLRSASNCRPEWISELLAYTGQHKLSVAQDAVQYLQASVPSRRGRGLSVRQLLAESTQLITPPDDVRLSLLSHVLPQLEYNWTDEQLEIRASTISNRQFYHHAHQSIWYQ
jgi:hypothetical protein